MQRNTTVGLTVFLQTLLFLFRPAVRAEFTVRRLMDTKWVSGRGFPPVALMFLFFTSKTVDVDCRWTQ